MRIRKGDMIKVVSGDDKGKVARVLRVIPESDKLLVEGVNMVFRHMRRSQKHPQGGRIRKEAPFRTSKVMLYVESTGRPVRVGSELGDDGKRVRVGRSGGNVVKLDAPSSSKKKK